MSTSTIRTEIQTIISQMQFRRCTAELIFPFLCVIYIPSEQINPHQNIKTTDSRHSVLARSNSLELF